MSVPLPVCLLRRVLCAWRSCCHHLRQLRVLGRRGSRPRWRAAQLRAAARPAQTTATCSRAVCASPPTSVGRRSSVCRVRGACGGVREVGVGGGEPGQQGWIGGQPWSAARAMGANPATHPQAHSLIWGRWFFGAACGPPLGGGRQRVCTGESGGGVWLSWRALGWLGRWDRPGKRGGSAKHSPTRSRQASPRSRRAAGLCGLCRCPAPRPTSSTSPALSSCRRSSSSLAFSPPRSLVSVLIPVPRPPLPPPPPLPPFPSCHFPWRLW